MFKMSTISMNTSMQTCWPRHQSATFPGLATHAAAHQCYQRDSDFIYTTQVELISI